MVEGINMKTILSVTDLLEKSKTFDGWFNEVEMNLMFDTVASLENKGCLVEIGSWCGRSLTVITAAAIKANLTVPIYSIDPYLTSKDEPNGMYEKFVSNLKSVGIWDRIKHIKEKSQIIGNKFNEDIEFVFIDGMNKYEAVKRDFELFYPKVINGGYIAFHDMFSFWGPTKLVQEILEQYSDLKFIKRESETLILQKVDRLSAQELQNNKQFLTKIKDFMSKHADKLHK